MHKPEDFSANVAVTLTVHLNLLIRRTAGLTGKRHTLSVAIPYLQITKPTLQLLIIILERPLHWLIKNIHLDMHLFMVHLYKNQIDTFIDMPNV